MSQPLNQGMGIRHGLETDDHKLNGRKIVVQSTEKPVTNRIPGLGDILGLIFIVIGVIAIVTGVSVAFGFAIGVLAFGACVLLLGILLAMQ